MLRSLLGCFVVLTDGVFKLLACFFVYLLDVEFAGLVVALSFNIDEGLWLWRRIMVSDELDVSRDVGSPSFTWHRPEEFMGELFAGGPVRCLWLLSLPQMSGLLCIVSSASSHVHSCSVAGCSDSLAKKTIGSLLSRCWIAIGLLLIVY